MRSKTGCSEPPSNHTALQNESTLTKTFNDEQKHKNVKEQTQTEMTCDNELNKRRFPGNQCDYSSAQRANLKRHQLRLHKTTFSCESCDYTTSIENHLKIHISYIHRADNIKRESKDDTESDAELEKLLQEDQEDIDTEEVDETVSDETANLDKSQLQDDLKNINSTQCPGCDKVLSNKFSTIRHFKSS